MIAARACGSAAAARRRQHSTALTASSSWRGSLSAGEVSSVTCARHSRRSNAAAGEEGAQLRPTTIPRANHYATRLPLVQQPVRQLGGPRLGVVPRRPDVLQVAVPRRRRQLRILQRCLRARWAAAQHSTAQCSAAQAQPQPQPQRSRSRSAAAAAAQRSRSGLRARAGQAQRGAQRHADRSQRWRRVCLSHRLGQWAGETGLTGDFDEATTADYQPWRSIKLLPPDR